MELPFVCDLTQAVGAELSLLPRHRRSCGQEGSEETVARNLSGGWDAKSAIASNHGADLLFVERATGVHPFLPLAPPPSRSAAGVFFIYAASQTQQVAIRLVARSERL
jgi:hypothetical protein